MNEKKDEMKLGNRYGFKFNLFTSTHNAVVQSKWLEKINPRQTVTLGRLIVSVVAVVLIAISIFIYIYTDLKRAMYEWKSLVFLGISVLLFFKQFLFPYKDNENEIINGVLFITQLIESFKVNMGWNKKFRAIGIKRVLRDGKIEYTNGQIGRMLLVDGSASKTAYPEDIYLQEQAAKSYQNGRNRTTTEIKITSSQYQECKEQIKELEQAILKNKHNKAIRDMLAKELYFTKNFIDGKEQTIVQHIILQDSTTSGLNASIERLRRYVNGKHGIYHSAIELNQKKTIECLKELYGFN